MKELLLGLGLVLVLGTAGFAYRVIIERPQLTSGVCTQEAKVCPNGASVGRSGPSCSFAPCPPPNVSFPEHAAAFALPEGYSMLPALETQNTHLIASFVSTTTDPTMRSIALYSYAIPGDGKDVETILLNTAIHSTSGEKVKSVSEFKKETIGGKEYYVITLERFEGIITSSYYLAREHDVLRFDVVEHDVQNWTDPKLVVEELSGHKALLSMLTTAQL